MAEFKALAWILIGLAVFIWRMIQKARATTAREQRERPRSGRQATPLPAGSFEDLLRQLQSQNQKPPVVPAAPPVTPAGRLLPQESAVPARSLERPSTAARSLEQPATPHSLEVPRREARRAATLPRATTQHGQDDYWSRQAATDQPRETRRTVTDMLRNPADVRAAFVLGEILQRRF